MYLTRPLTESFLFPLLFAPGDAWDYSVGIDWAGIMVERLNGNITLQAYLEKNIWGPLEVKSMTFHPTSNPAILEKLVDMSERAGGVTPYHLAADPEGKVGYTTNRAWNMESTPGCSGGAGGYGAPYDYQKMLQSICSDDGKLLKSSTIDEMFKPQLSDAARQSLMEKLAVPEMNQAYGGLPAGTKVDWGIGGILVMEDLPGRRKGSMSWGGYPNLLWWIDRESGMSGIYGSNFTPPGDLKTISLFYMWEKEMYARAGKGK